MKEKLVDLDSLRGLDAYRQAEATLIERMTEIDREAAGMPFSDEQRAEFEEIAGDGGLLESVRTTIAELEIREKAVASAIEAGGRKVEHESSYPLVNVIKSVENVYDLAAYRQRVNSVDALPQAYRDGAMRAIEQMTFPTAADPDKARGQLAKVVDKHRNEEFGKVSQHVIGTSNPQYVAAWQDKMTGKALTGQRLAVMQTYGGDGSDGGLAIPVEIDPTFINVSDGQANPLRAISRIETTSGKTWSAITTAGVTASYVGERTSSGASDGAPTDLDNPTVTPVRADVAVDLTLEFLQDYGESSLLAQLGGLIAEAKDNLEADQFVNGDGSDAPDGIVARLITDASSIVQTTGNDAFALADIDKLVGALPPRFRSGARFLANHAILQLTPAFGTAGQPGNSIYDPLSNSLRGYPAHEASYMDAATTDANHILLFGNFRYFVIVDKLGLTTRSLPTVDGSGRPTGGTTVYAAWRNSTKPLSVNAFRLLKVA